MTNFDFSIYRTDLLESTLKKLTLAHLPLAIWGCGPVGQKALEFMRENNIEPACFTDSSQDMQGKLIEGEYPVVAPAPILESKSHYVVISSAKYSQEMISELLNHGFERDVDYLDFSTLYLALRNDVMNAHTGYCPICENETVFIEIGTWLRDYYRCINCRSIPRMRSLIRTLNRFVPDWHELTVHESSPSDISLKYFEKRGRNYSYSNFYPHITPGEYHNGIRCENLESLTFSDNSIDIFITQDVFEHLMNPELAFKEIERVLKVGGYHIFSVPIYEHNNKSIRLAKMASDKIEYLAEPEYHGPFLVTFHHSMDITEIIGQNIHTTIVLEKDRNYGIDGEFLHIFVCRKTKN